MKNTYSRLQDLVFELEKALASKPHPANSGAWYLIFRLERKISRSVVLRMKRANKLAKLAAKGLLPNPLNCYKDN